MNTKVYFFCKDTHDKTRFYHYITDRNFEEYEDDPDQILLDDGVIDELQQLSRHGMLDNWSIIKTEDCTKKVQDFDKAVSDENFLNDDDKYIYMDEQEQIIARTNKNLKKAKAKLKPYTDISSLSKKELYDLYTELHQKLKDIGQAYKEKETKEEESKAVFMRDYLLNHKAMISESGWIDRTGRYWNVQAADHDKVATLKWGSVRNAEMNNIRISSSQWGTYVLISPDARKPPNNKQIQTLYKWGETFNSQRDVAEFEKYLKKTFYND